MEVPTTRDIPLNSLNFSDPTPASSIEDYPDIKKQNADDGSEPSGSSESQPIEGTVVEYRMYKRRYVVERWMCAARSATG